MGSPLLFLPGIIAVGLVSSYTDFKYGCIRNVYLLWGLGYGCASYLFLFLSGNLGYSILFLSANFTVAAAVSYVLYIKHVWSAGDAKLFIVLAFLSPWLKYAHMFRFPAVSLLINIGAISLLYLLIFDGKAVFSHLLHLSKQELIDRATSFCKNLATVFSITWIVWFYVGKLRISEPLMIFTLLSLCYFLLHLALKWFSSHRWGFALFLAAGLAARLVLDPGIFVSSDRMLDYLGIVIRLTIFFSILNAIFFKSEKNMESGFPGKNDEKAFAPLIFFGALSLQSPLASFIVTVMRGS